MKSARRMLAAPAQQLLEAGTELTKQMLHLLLKFSFTVWWPRNLRTMQDAQS